MQQDNSNQNNQNQADDQAQYASGVSPEASVVSPSSAESVSSQESGYEQIRKIEQQAANVEKKGSQVNNSRPQDKQIVKPQTIEKKEPEIEKPKVFGYNPPPNLISNPKLVKSKVGKGNSHDSKTWLIMLLDRIFKQQSS